MHRSPNANSCVEQFTDHDRFNIFKFQTNYVAYMYLEFAT